MALLDVWAFANLLRSKHCIMTATQTTFIGSKLNLIIITILFKWKQIETIPPITESNGLSRSIAWGHKMTFHDLISLNLMSYCMTTFIFQGNACICIERQNLCWKICLTTTYRSSNLLLIVHISISDMMAITWSSLHHDKSCSLGFEQPNDIIFIVDHHPTFCCLDVF